MKSVIAASLVMVSSVQTLGGSSSSKAESFQSPRASISLFSPGPPAKLVVERAGKDDGIARNVGMASAEDQMHFRCLVASISRSRLSVVTSGMSERKISMPSWFIARENGLGEVP